MVFKISLTGCIAIERVEDRRRERQWEDEDSVVEQALGRYATRIMKKKGEGEDECGTWECKVVKVEIHKSTRRRVGARILLSYI